jgi:hypothetical protein
MAITVQFQKNPLPAFSSFQSQNSELLHFFFIHFKVHVSETGFADLFPSWRYEVGRHLLSWIRQTEPFLIIQQLPQLPFHLGIETDAEAFNKRDVLFYFPIYDQHPAHHIHFDTKILAVLHMEDE